MSFPLIELKDIVITKQEREILSIPHLCIEKHDILGVMGPNGAGKSTLMKILALLDTPETGRIAYLGKEIGETIALETRRKFAVAMQQSLLLDTTVQQNVAIGLKMRGISRNEINKRVAHWLDVFSIGHLANTQASHLSGGEAQRVNLARAMVLEPEALFLDEPFSALDFPTKVQLLKDMKEVVENTRTTVVFISHDMMEIKYFTNRLLVLMDGEIKQLGPTEEVLSNPNPAASPFIGEWNRLIR